MDKKLQYFSGAFPDSSICDLEFEVKMVIRSGDELYNKSFIAPIRELCSGKIFRNMIEDEFDFSKDEQVIEFMKKKCDHHFEVFDSSSDISVMTFKANVFYGNIRVLSDENKKMIKKGTIQTFFARINVDEKV